MRKKRVLHAIIMLWQRTKKIVHTHEIEDRQWAHYLMCNAGSLNTYGSLVAFIHSIFFWLTEKKKDWRDENHRFHFNTNLYRYIKLYTQIHGNKSRHIYLLYSRSTTKFQLKVFMLRRNDIIQYYKMHRVISELCANRIQIHIYTVDSIKFKWMCICLCLSLTVVKIAVVWVLSVSPHVICYLYWYLYAYSRL